MKTRHSERCQIPHFAKKTRKCRDNTNIKPLPPRLSYQVVLITENPKDRVPLMCITGHDPG